MSGGSLAGRRALVTGGGTGVGAEIARALAAAGAEVVVTGRRAGPLDAIVGATPGIVACVVGDVTVEADVARMFDAAGAIDIVVANAGVADSAPLRRTELELWERMLATNLTGVFLTLREAARRMHGRGWGRLVTVASTAGLKGYPYTAAYTASKHGAVGLTRAIATELAGSGITANALCPGFVDTEMTERTLANIVATTGRTAEQALAALTADNPLGRLVGPAEVAAAVLWLCGPGSDIVNGQAIALDGGET